MSVLEINTSQSLLQLAVALNIAFIALETVITPVYSHAFELYNDVLSVLSKNGAKLSKREDEETVNELFLRNVQLIKIFDKLSLFKKKDNRILYWYTPYICSVCAGLALILLFISSIYPKCELGILFSIIGLFINIIPIVISIEKYNRSKKYITIIEPELYKLKIWASNIVE